MSHRTPQSPADETLARVRRIETRLTQLMIHQGVAPQVEKPVFDSATGATTIPSLRSSLQEILDSVPQGWQGPVGVYIGGNLVATLR